MSFLSTYRIPLRRGYSEGTYLIEDTSELSPDYFNVEFFPMVLGGGRYVIKVKGNGVNMRMNSSIDVEIIDAEGERIFCEVADYVDRFNNYYISVDIYDITAQGLATAYFVGEAIVDLNGNPVPLSNRGEYNVRWTKQFNVLPFERNNAELIFDEPPVVSVAQVIIPATVSAQSSASAYNFTSITSSNLNIVTSNFSGYDRDFASSADILDPRLKAIRVNPLGQPMTINSVPTAIRTDDQDIQKGSHINYTSRFNTIVQASQAFFKKEHLGGYFEFYDSASYPKQLSPTLPNGITISGSVWEQLNHYNSTIVEIVNDKQAILSKPISIITKDANSRSRNTYSTFDYKAASIFTASIAYVPTDLSFITSSTVSQSYVEFTFTDLNPISGQTYRIRTSIKSGASTGDYKLLNDQVVTPVEYLTDAQFKNGLNYARHESDYRLIGYFTTQSLLDTYWDFYREDKLGFDVVTGSLSSTKMIESALLPAAYTQSCLFTTKYNQNYTKEQIYTLGFYLTLDPYTELEVYMNSDPLNAYISVPSVYPRAFLKSNNMERQRYGGSQNRFGKYIGKISNDRATSKYYGKVLFDFETDGSGYGQPVFRSRTIDEMSGVTGSSYVSEISIKPYLINGFTPNIVQYAVPLPSEFIATAVLSQSIDFKIEYFDYTGRQSEYTTFLDDVILNLKGEIPSNTCQDDKLYFYYNSGLDFTEYTPPPKG